MTAPTYTAGQAVVLDAYDGPLVATYLGTTRSRLAGQRDRVMLRVRVEEAGSGFEQGEEIDALPERVRPATNPLREADRATFTAYLCDVTAEVRRIVAEQYDGEPVDWEELWAEHFVITAVPDMVSVTSRLPLPALIEKIQTIVRDLVERG